MSFKTIAGPKLVTIGRGVRVRDIEFPPAPVRVSDHAQAIPLDINTIRQFNFTQDVSPVAIPSAVIPLPERPSTSGGPGTTSNLSLRRNADKRETKDDLYFGIASEKTTTFYNFPLPGSLPTPTESIKSVYSPPPRHSSLPRSYTPDSIDMPRQMEVQQMEIGMALGSPTHQPTVWESQTYQNLRNPSPETFQDSIDEPVVPAPVKQKSKWKMFGGLFGGTKKQNNAQTQNFYQVQAGEPPSEVEVAQAPDEPRKSMHPSRARTNSERKASKRKPPVKRSNTAPGMSEPRPKTAPGNPEILLEGRQIEDTEPKARGGLMLNVDIPSVELERYSVMFGSLLPQKSGNSTSSLLTRRQATLDRLKTVNEELALKEQELEEKAKKIKQPRRATSPQPRGSPAFSLFPTTPGGRDIRSNRTPSPNGPQITLHRSNTSPAALSPSRPSFAPRSNNEIHATLMEPGPHIPDSYETDDSAVEISSLRVKSSAVRKKQVPIAGPMSRQAVATPHSLTTVRTFTPDQSHLSLSPDSDSDMYVDFEPPPAKARVTESLRQMDSKQSLVDSVSGSASSESEHSKSASGSSVSTSESTTPHSAALTTQKQIVAQSPLKQNAINANKIPMSKMNQNPLSQAQITTRARSATTSGAVPSQLPRPIIPSQKITEISNALPKPTNQSSTSLHKINTQPKLSRKEEEDEERLNTLANVSIARQISVSRQQRQLLIPISGSFSKKKNPLTESTNSSPGTTASTPITKRGRSATTSASITPSPIIPFSATSSPAQYNPNFPSPLYGRDRTAVPVSVNVSQVTSPLAAVEIASKEEKRSLEREAQGLQRQESSMGKSKIPSVVIKGTERREKEERERERLVEGVKAGLPMLVIVGGDERNGNSSGSGNGSGERISIAERRRKARENALTNGERRGHEYRKSERAVVERVS